jgi:dTDP-3-amino-3,4,6-trideoxy-alpha-D-glucose transaminase
MSQEKWTELMKNKSNKVKVDLAFDAPELISLQKIGDKKNCICVIEYGSGLPFVVKRNYLVTSTGKSIKRGYHAHKKLQQLIICVAGTCKIKLTNSRENLEFTLESPEFGLFIPAGWWREYELSENATISVLASEIFEEKDYIREYSAFEIFDRAKNKDKNIPFLNLRGLNQRYMNDFVLSLQESLDSGEFVGGKSVMEFEAAFSEYCGVKHTVSCANGYDALYLSLVALGVRAGDEVIVPTNSFIATAFAVSRAGAVPVFVDCYNKNYSIDLNQAAAVLSKKTVGIIPVHLFGIPADMDLIKEFAKRHKLFVIEDAAQAHGARFKTNVVGGLGDIGCFSFYPSKNLGALGDGGCIVTNSGALHRKLETLKNYGAAVKNSHESFGLNSRLDSFQALILKQKLYRLDMENSQRQKIAEIYQSRLENDWITLPKALDVTTAVWHVFPIVIKYNCRDKVRKYLQECGIETSVHYPIPTHKCGAYQNGGLVSRKAENLEISEYFSKNSISLPMGPLLSTSEAHRVCDALIQSEQRLRLNEK